MGVATPWLLHIFLGIVAASWVETINQAGMQTTLSQMMTKEFLLISRGTKVSMYKSMLFSSMQRFNSTLHALRVGDESRGILAAPNHQVVAALDAVQDVWGPMQELLNSNVDSVRHADGSIDMQVLEDLSSRNVPLLDRSNEVVQAISDAAQVFGATTNGLVQNIAGRQRTLIQRLAEGVLLLAQNVAMSKNMVAFQDTKILFEESHHGIIEGVPFAGLPVLDKLCTIHQMSEVSYFYAKLRPLLNGVSNADTPSKSQAAADAVAEEVVELVDPLYVAMVEAVDLYGHDSGNCDPVSSMTEAEWSEFLTTFAHQQLWTQQATQYFVQVAMKVDIKTSQVEITVLKSEATLNLRRLIEGSKILGIPPPPTPEVVDHLLKAAEIWNTLESELDEGIHLESISEVTLERVELLSHKLLHELELVMEECLPLLVNSTVPVYAMDLAEQLARLASMIVEEALLIHHGHAVEENWHYLNATREVFNFNRWTLLHGAPATTTRPKVEQVSDVCIVQQMKRGTDLYRVLEEKALAVAFGDHDALEPLVQLGPTAVGALNELALSFFRGNGSCSNSSMAPEQWIQLHRQVAQLSDTSAELAVELVLFQQGLSPNDERLNALMEEVDSALTRVMFGSFDPPVPAPPDQIDFNELLLYMEPSVKELKRLSIANAYQGNLRAALAAEDQLMEHTLVLQEHFMKEALAMDPTWPGERVDLALRQITRARQVLNEALLYTLGLTDSQERLQAVTEAFQAGHVHLRDGGDRVPKILLPERQDILDQWLRVDSAWIEFQQQKQDMTADSVTKVEASLGRLVLSLKALVSVLAVPDVEDEDGFPWAVIIYSSIGFLFLCACCCFCCKIKTRSKGQSEKKTTTNGAAVSDQV